MRRLALVACAVLLTVPVVLKSRTGQNSSGHAAFRMMSSGRVAVKVAGNVRHPGVYMVSAKKMAEDAINMAEPLCRLRVEGAGGVAGVVARNGAAFVVESTADDSCNIHAERMTVPECLVLGIPLDISIMTESDFDRLPGVGPALARKIVEYRQKNGGKMRVEELQAVSGIGEKKYEALKKYFQHAENKR